MPNQRKKMFFHSVSNARGIESLTGAIYAFYISNASCDFVLFIFGEYSRS